MNAGELPVGLFVALPVPAEVKSRLADVQDELRAQLSHHFSTVAYKSTPWPENFRGYRPGRT